MLLHWLYYTCMRGVCDGALTEPLRVRCSTCVWRQFTFKGVSSHLEMGCLSMGIWENRGLLENLLDSSVPFRDKWLCTTRSLGKSLETDQNDRFKRLFWVYKKRPKANSYGSVWNFILQQFQPSLYFFMFHHGERAQNTQLCERNNKKGV